MHAIVRQGRVASSTRVYSQLHGLADDLPDLLRPVVAGVELEAVADAPEVDVVVQPVLQQVLLEQVDPVPVSQQPVHGLGPHQVGRRGAGGLRRRGQVDAACERE